jgi:D-alanyl-D-alanine carboxypeptidase (penicillin-binding protein 5/6)
MKKSNGTLIALILIAIHALLFFVLIGKSGEQTMEPSVPQSNQPEPVAETAAVPDMITPSAPATAPPNRVPPIYTPASETGRLRNDLPDRRTTRNYASLKGNPYSGAIVIDAQSGKILLEDRSTTHGYPASVTKLMTLLLTLEAIDRGETALKERVRITEEAAGIGGSQLWLDTRETDLTVEDLLYGIVVHSANDAARALGIHVAGSREAFVERMNRRARELGMNATRYVSDHGLPPEDNSQPDISTPYDIALLSLACLRHPKTLTFSGTELLYIRDGKTMLATRNALAKRVDGYAGCDGLKTGYHQRGGWSLAATAERNGRRIVSVVLGAPDKQTRNTISRQLLDSGFKALETNR